MVGNETLRINGKDCKIESSMESLIGFKISWHCSGKYGKAYVVLDITGFDKTEFENNQLTLRFPEIEDKT